MSLMKKSFFILWLFILSPALLTAQTAQDARRIEEEKRESLQSTERSIPEEIPIRLPAEYPDTAAYFQELVKKPVATHSDATRALVLLLGEQDSVRGFAPECAFLQERKVIDGEAADLKKNAVLRKGLAALLLSRTLNIRGGIFKRLFRNSQRYALRELAYEGIMPQGSTGERLSGKELVGIFIQAARYLTRKQTSFEGKP